MYRRLPDNVGGPADVVSRASCRGTPMLRAGITGRTSRSRPTIACRPHGVLYLSTSRFCGRAVNRTQQSKQSTCGYHESDLRSEPREKKLASHPPIGHNPKADSRNPVSSDVPGPEWTSSPGGERGLHCTCRVWFHGSGRPVLLLSYCRRWVGLP